jgi:drug/metabolite transporter (DMT)-like permease
VTTTTSVVTARAHGASAARLSAGVAVFSVQDVVIKALSGGYPVHEAIVIRSVAALPILVWMVRRTGRPARPVDVRGRGVLIVRGLLQMVAYTAYYLALPAMSLASAVALWFTAPLFLAALSGVVTRERASRGVWIAVAFGFAGVLVMVRPGGDLFQWVAALPVVAALMYALAQLVARRAHEVASAPVMSLYQNAVYLVAASVLALALQPFAGTAPQDESVAFLVRGWAVPSARDLALFAACGPIAALASTLLASAYRTAGSVVAPFEFTALVWATAWGVLVWGDVPGTGEILGAAIIVASGAYALSR